MAKRAESKVETHVGSRHLITTEAKVARCRVCGELVLRGYSDGIPTTVGIAPVRDESAARAAGLWTYNLWRGRLNYRESWTREGGGDYGPILADHRHG
jgi:hypothetical protein